MKTASTSYPTEYSSALIEPNSLLYDNMPIDDRPANPGRVMHHWRVPINQVDQVQRDERVLDGAIELVLEKCYQHKVLSFSKTIELLIAKSDGDETAKEELIMHNLRLVVHIAKKYYRYAKQHQVEMNDLVQMGTEGLIHAVERTDPDKCVRENSFSTYCGYNIEHYIQKSLGNESRLIRLPMNVHVERVSQIKVENMLRGELGREPSIEEVAERLAGYPPELPKIETDDEGWILGDTPEYEVVRTIHARPYAVLDAIKKATKIRTSEKRTIPIDFLEVSDRPEDEEALIDPGADLDDIVNDILIKEEVQRLIKALPTRGGRMLGLRYGLKDDKNHTLDEIGREFKLSRERVRQILDESQKRLLEMGFSKYVDEREPEKPQQWPRRDYIGLGLGSLAVNERGDRYEKYLDDRRARMLRPFKQSKMEPISGFEPLTYSLRKSRSTN